MSEFQEPPRILLTGGAGYIGSHTFVGLHEAGFRPIILDNFSNAHWGVVERLKRLTGCAVEVEKIDLLDTAATAVAIRRYKPVGVIHLAGDKAVGESVAQPLKYYHNNLAGTISLLRALEDVQSDLAPLQVRTLVFSSSATVYGDPGSVPIGENAPRGHTSPYGHTKLVIEDMLRALLNASPSWRIGVLRYFNPVGAHPSGLIGEDPRGVPNNLMPYVAQVALGVRPALNVFGTDYSTPDGTGVRDYIHVQDLAAGHVAALTRLLDDRGSFTVNLGTGRGYTVLEVVRAFERASGRTIPLKYAARRHGDVPICYADPTRARHLLGWQALRTLDEMCRDTWRWQSKNPRGYADGLLPPAADGISSDFAGDPSPPRLGT